MITAQNRQRMNHACFIATALAACWMATGCADTGDRPDIGKVTGVVTLDGQPLPRVSVSFAQPGFRPSIGETDSEGRYELTYIRDVKGAALGTHVVRIKRFAKEGERGKQLPSRYNSASELTREVKPGRNELDFELTSHP